MYCLCAKKHLHTFWYAVTNGIKVVNLITELRTAIVGRINEESDEGSRFHTA